MLQFKNSQLQRFWDVWQTEYIRNLPLIKQPTKNKQDINGILCLVKEDNIGRIHWPLGKIVETFQGKDGVVRTVKIKTSKGYMMRPLDKVCCLEVLDETNRPTDHMIGASKSTKEVKDIAQIPKKKTPNVKNKEDSVIPYVTRAGRVVKPKKYD